MKKKRIICAIVIIACIVIVSLIFINNAYAVSPTPDIYENWGLEKSSMLRSFFRWLGWQIVLFLRNIANLCEYLFESAIKFMSFGISDVVTSFITSKINPFIGVLLGIGILFFGIAVMMLMNIDRNKIVINFMLLFVSLIGLPIIMTEFTEISGMAVKMFMSDSDSAATSVVKLHLIDFKYVDRFNFNAYMNQTNNLSDNSVIALDTDETIDPGDNDLYNPDIFDSEVKIDSYGNLVVDQADFGGWFGIGSAYYYRYNYDFLSIVLTLLATIIVFFFMSFKGIKIGWELAFSRAFLTLVSPVDITAGAKTKKILMEIVTMYVVFVFIGMTFRFFTLGTNYITVTFDNWLLRSILILFLAMIVIDGPNVVEKVLGMDVGIKSSMSSLMGAIYGANTLRGMLPRHGGSIGQTMFNAAKSGVGNAASKISSMSLGNNVYSTAPNNPDNTNTEAQSNGIVGDNNAVKSTSSSPADGVPFSGTVGNVDNGMPSFDDLAAPPPTHSDANENTSDAMDDMSSMNTVSDNMNAAPNNTDYSSDSSSLGTNMPENMVNDSSIENSGLGSISSIDSSAPFTSTPTADSGIGGIASNNNNAIGNDIGGTNSAGIFNDAVGSTSINGTSMADNSDNCDTGHTPAGDIFNGAGSVGIDSPSGIGSSGNTFDNDTDIPKPIFSGTQSPQSKASIDTPVNNPGDNIHSPKAPDTQAKSNITPTTPVSGSIKENKEVKTEKIISPKVPKTDKEKKNKFKKLNIPNKNDSKE